MSKVKKINTPRETEEIYKGLQGEGQPLPPFLYGDPQYTPVVVSYIKGGNPAGLTFGVIQEKDETFYMHYLRMAASASGWQDVICFTEQFLGLIKRDYKVSQVIMLLEQKDDAVPAYARLLENVEGCTLKKITFLRQVGVNTADFGHFRKYHWYCPELLHKKGYDTVRIDDFPRQWQEELRKKELEGSLPEDYLSPGLWEENWGYDPDTSFVLVRKGEKAPSGWIVTEPMAQDIVKIRRFYTYRAERCFWLGPSFSTWVLDRISEKYRQLWFEVEKGNRQMEMFTFCYCKPILAFNYIKCNLTIQLN
ncbi:hypothetical protein [Luxibacter massiliensis]|uniref:hypothetical protein n=1 Tax=Luxibacter massiliensis TaxID=2219695 RepID=UPI000F04EC98|nr:hypothetical protein [Luxibacter massiliensis]